MQNIKGNREGKGKRWNGIEFNVPQQSIDFPGNKGKIQRGQSIIQGCPISLWPGEDNIKMIAFNLEKQGQMFGGIVFDINGLLDIQQSVQ